MIGLAVACGLAAAALVGPAAASVSVLGLDASLICLSVFLPMLSTALIGFFPRLMSSSWVGMFSAWIMFLVFLSFIFVGVLDFLCVMVLFLCLVSLLGCFLILVLVLLFLLIGLAVAFGLAAAALIGLSTAAVAVIGLSAALFCLAVLLFFSSYGFDWFLTSLPVFFLG